MGHPVKNIFYFEATFKKKKSLNHLNNFWKQSRVQISSNELAYAKYKWNGAYLSAKISDREIYAGDDKYFENAQLVTQPLCGYGALG